MKKIILPLLTLALTVASMTSCSSDGDRNDMTPAETPQTSTSNDYYAAQIAIADETLQYGTFTLVVTADGKTQEFKINDGKSHIIKEEVTDLSQKVIEHPAKIVTTPTIYSKNHDTKYELKYEPNSNASVLAEKVKVRYIYTFDKINSADSSIKFISSSANLRSGVKTTDDPATLFNYVVSSFNKTMK